ncbi:TetR family transcriptional regulator [Nocardia seriolae]|uniref:TetR family transcriptional regulator n=2 Tax=Nocardia seriolae TaxID=37332 RepID=A0ABC9YZ43_9NOCA|nr:transcriptional regulator [Nocardia seriolae]GEM26117.1 TetR family transcriptional regulator [Nocardia seriolae NBRC 15557]BEK87809.1 TetR/AcrR family transcriptional regulator [Nocardia seriolae]BEK95372.1 TetR/AcrR family transcriptional regulator [Nocardia seriolae]GAM48558.1 TetR family transcriptional regulator [Nocardia seriolae]
MMGMSVPYEETGRRNQKSRTRSALVSAARKLLADSTIPTVEDAAAAAGISRTTAYRYFPNQRALLAAAHPEIDRDSLLPDPAPTDPHSRLDLVMSECVRIILDWEPELRASLRLSLDPGAGNPSPLRRGRAIGWLEHALSPLRDSHPHIDIHRLAVTIRSATGIESFIWLVDIAGLHRPEAAETLCGTARALLSQALTDDS